MKDIVFKNENNSFCPNCHSKLPTELTHINEIGEVIIFCPYCGTQIILKKNKGKNEEDKKLLEISAETKEKDDMKFSLTEKEIRHIIRMFIYRNIYQLIKQTKSNMKRLTWQKDISTSQIAHVSSKIRKILLKTSNPGQVTTKHLNNPRLKKIENYLKTVKAFIKERKTFRKKYAHLLAEIIEFSYNIIRGDYEFEDLTETKRRIVLNLKELFGFKEEKLSKKSVIYNVSLFLALKIYNNIRQNKNTRLEKSVVNEITSNITEILIDKRFCKQLFNNLETFQKRKFSCFLKQFQFDITYDWIYRTSFQDHLLKLIFLVNQLFLEKEYWLNLTGAEKLIAEGLQEIALFQNDSEFSAYMRLSFILVLCRIIHKIMQDTPEIPQTISKYTNLNPSTSQEINEYILNEITTQKKINYEFLGKFYNLTLEEFQANYEKFQTKLANDMIYYYSFRNYIGKLIKIVYAITHTIGDKSKISKFKRVIIKDLANYNFRWNPERGNKYYFYLDKKEEICDCKEDQNENLKKGRNDDNDEVNSDFEKVQVISKKHHHFLSKHKKFLDYIATKFKEKSWNLQNYQKPTKSDKIIINNILNKYLEMNECNLRNQKFYKLIIRAVPLIFDKKKCLSGNSLTNSLDTGSALINRHVALYLNPKKYQRKNNYGYLLTKSIRNYLCKGIYKILTKHGVQLDKKNVLDNLKNNLEIEISKGNEIKQGNVKDEILKLCDSEYFSLIEDNIIDLIEIIKALIKYSYNSNKLYTNDLAKNLIKNKKVTTYKFNGLNRAIVQIFKILNESFQEFDLTRNKLFSEDKLLNLDRKAVYSKYPKMKSSELAQIKVFLREIKIIEELNEKLPKNLQKQCTECNTSIKYLPVFQFHHENGEKSITWDEIKFLPFDKVKELMLNEALKVLCANCHEKKQATIYNTFKGFIYSQELFKYSFSKIHRLIVEEIKRLGITRKRIELKIKAWISKRYIIENFYYNECLSCGKSCSIENLPCFVFHHRTKKKTEKWSNMKSKNIKGIIKWLKNDECICLCTNCHIMLHSKLYVKYSDIIFNNDDLKLELIEEISRMKKRIKEFDYDHFQIHKLN